MRDVIRRERPSLAVSQPFLADLIPADLELPHFFDFMDVGFICALYSKLNQTARLHQCVGLFGKSANSTHESTHYLALLIFLGGLGYSHERNMSAMTVSQVGIESYRANYLVVITWKITA